MGKELAEVDEESAREKLLEQWMEDAMKGFPDVAYEPGDDAYILLKEMITTERRVRAAFTQIVDLTKDQRELSGNVLGKHVRPFDQRKEFCLKDPLLQLPDGIPFELYCFWRTYLVPEYSGTSINEFFHSFMFSFEFDFTLFQ